MSDNLRTSNPIEDADGYVDPATVELVPRADNLGSGNPPADLLPRNGGGQKFETPAASGGRPFGEPPTMTHQLAASTAARRAEEEIEELKADVSSAPGCGPQLAAFLEACDATVRAGDALEQFEVSVADVEQRAREGVQSAVARGEEPKAVRIPSPDAKRIELQGRLAGSLERARTLRDQLRDAVLAAMPAQRQAATDLAPELLATARDAIAGALTAFSNATGAVEFAFRSAKVPEGHIGLPLPSAHDGLTGLRAALAYLDDSAVVAIAAGNPPSHPRIVPSREDRAVIARANESAVGYLPEFLALAKTERAEQYAHTRHTQGIAAELLDERTEW